MARRRREVLSGALLQQIMERQRREGCATSPIPEDPFFTVLPGFLRAKDGNSISPVTEAKMSKRESRHQERSTNKDGNGHVKRSCPNGSQDRPSRRKNREMSPSMLPGVRSVPEEIMETLKDQLSPGEYYAKSMTQYLGPFEQEPTEEQLPSGDTYFILQSMGRTKETGKCVFRNVRKLTIPPRKPPARSISPSELPGVRVLSAELHEKVRRDLKPEKYYAKSMTRYLGPYDNIPTKDMLPKGESYVILQGMGRLTTDSERFLVLRKITQLDC